MSLDLFLRVAGVAVAVLPMTLLSGCRDETRQAGVLRVRDSAGVRIVEAVRPVTPSAIEVVAEPLFHLGWGPGGPQFENISGGFIRLDGGVLVVDAGASTLFAVDAAGEAIRTTGGAGEGPGEFQSISSLVPLPADSFLVADDANDRVSFFHDLEHVDDARFQGFFSPALYEPFARRGDGAYWLGPSAWAVGLLAQEAPGWVKAPLLASADFTTFDTVALFPALYNPGDANPIRPGAYFVPSGERIAYLSGDVAQITWLGGDGQPEQIARWDAVPEELTDEDWARYEAGFRERNEGADPATVERILADRRRDWGGDEPLFRFAIGDRTGGVWLTPHEVAEAGASSLYARRYEVVAADGVHMGAVSFPNAIRVLDVTADRVLGVERDEFDVQAIALYRLVRGQE